MNLRQQKRIIYSLVLMIALMPLSKSLFSKSSTIDPQSHSYSLSNSLDSDNVSKVKSCDIKNSVCSGISMQAVFTVIMYTVPVIAFFIVGLLHLLPLGLRRMYRLYRPPCQNALA